jgi:hypothetical protein
MSSNSYGPMQGFMDGVTSLPGKLDKALPTPPAWFYKMLGHDDPNPVPDVSWHNQMVQQAHDSFLPQNQPAPATAPVIRRKIPVTK